MNRPKTLIIAEAGVNHNGDISLAKRLVEVAADSGADIVKFQTFSADRLVTVNAVKARYQLQAGNRNESQYTMLKRLELSRDLHEVLINHCWKHNIEFFSTGFDIPSVSFLAELGLTRFKIPSGEITNLPYLRHIGQFNSNIILSTGMATLGDIEAAIDALELSGTHREKITVLHCTTDYPAPFEDVNLRVIESLKSSLGVEVGYSDHTSGIEVGIAAVALGASIIEKHFTLDRNLPGPDHAASLLPEELTSMIRAIRNIENALGSSIKRPTPSELSNIAVVRKSIIASRSILKGETFSDKNLTTKRPGTGISPMRWDEIIGRIANRDYQQDELIEI